jgi:hypothetical protein
MTKQQLIQIAKAGFSDTVNKLINYENCEIYSRDNVFRLYDKKTKIVLGLPKKCYISVEIEDKFINIGTGNLSFNHYAAVKIIQKLFFNE